MSGFLCCLTLDNVFPYIAVLFQSVSNVEGDLHIWERNIFISLSDEDWRMSECVCCIFSAALRWGEKSEPPGSLPGTVRETRLSRWCLSTLLWIQMAVATEGQNPNIIESVSSWSSIFALCYSGFSKTSIFFFNETWEKLYKEIAYSF